MKTAAKVVTMATARQLAAGGWSEPTERVWAEVKPGRGMLVRVARLMPHEGSLYPIYPAPDISELLSALSHYQGFLRFEIDPEGGCWAGIEFKPDGGTALCELAYTLTDAMAKLWCELKSKEAQ